MLDKPTPAKSTSSASNAASDADAPPSPLTINAAPAAPARCVILRHDQHQPTVLYNAMINPCRPTPFAGAIWYQGESITGGTQGLLLYGHVMDNARHSTVAQALAPGDFPFYVVQLPTAGTSATTLGSRAAGQDSLAPQHLMAVVLDTGEAKNVHPKEQGAAGRRNLSKIALAMSMVARSNSPGQSTRPAKSRAARFASSSPTATA